MHWLIPISLLAILVLLRASKRPVAPASATATRLRELADADAWPIAGIRSAEEFFRAVPSLCADATVVYLEGSPTPDVVQVLEQHADHTEYGGPIGTIWSWPREQRYTLRASPQLFAGLADVAPRHAEPEICSHLHFYRQDQPLGNWFDAFDAPFFVSKSIPRERVDQFCAALGVTLSDDAA